jgi:hypothetical protein
MIATILSAVIRPRCFAILTLWGLVLTAGGAALSPRRATMVRGGGGLDGKCTIEVGVDGTADVAVSGDTAYLETLYGRNASWRRFECTAIMPRNIGEFRFSGIGGRGTQTLLRDPRSNRGTAVVRINDPWGTRENYTFTLEWRTSGGAAWPPPPGLPPDGQFPAARVIRACQDGVVDHLAGEGYRQIAFNRTLPENNPGRHDWVTGMASAKGGSATTWFAFSCSVDFSSGAIRYINLHRR